MTTDPAHVLNEGEGDTSVAEWRAGHEFTVNDATSAVLQRFRLVKDLRLVI